MKIGSLFSGYGGLDMGVMSVLGGEVAWHVEFDEAPSRILAHHWPDVPNYGDVTTVDWPAVAPVDLLTAGYPCQPFSMIGNRRGANDDRHLWPNVLDAVRNLRPRIVVLENVRGHLTLGFDRVLGDLAEVGYDAQWVCIPASAAGAPHRRERIFIVASDAGRVDPERRGEHRGVVGTPGSGQGADSEREWYGNATDDRGTTNWGEYTAAIERWERELGRVAPAPTAPDGRVGQHRLTASFVEWMMGLPSGHVTDPAIGLTRAQQLKALGNGVVPQQAALALTLLGVWT
jgi:DNA (cytosine-5)-methyltransferase 1